MCVVNLNNYCFHSKMFAKLYFLLENMLPLRKTNAPPKKNFPVLHFHFSEIIYFKMSPSSIYIGKLLIWYRYRTQKLAKRRPIFFFHLF